MPNTALYTWDILVNKTEKAATHVKLIASQGKTEINNKNDE